MELDKKIEKHYENFDKYVVIPNEISNSIENFKYTKKHNNVKELIKRIITIIVGICTIAGGVVFAKDYILKTFWLGNGIDTAIENGYIYNNDESVEEKINNNGINANIKEFLMDDTNISAEISFQIPNELKKDINIQNIKIIELSDLIITDENKNILFCANEKALREFCKNNNLNYEFGTSTEKYFGGGLNIIVQPSSSDNELNLIYNMYLGGIEDNYPKSKHLKYKFNTIKIEENNEEQKKYKIIEGNWNIEVDVPEIMYNRNIITYKSTYCSDKNIEITTAKATKTGFEFGCIMRNVELPENIKRYKENIYRKDITEEQRSQYFKEYREARVPLTPIISYYDIRFGETIEDCTYIENQKNEKFLIGTNPGRKQKQQFINERKDFVFYETFDLTQYDITNELKLHIMFYDKAINLTLHKK